MPNEEVEQVEDGEAEEEEEEADLATPSRSAFYVIYLLLGLFCVCFSFVPHFVSRLFLDNFFDGF